MATDFPECEFLGIDIASLQPSTILPKIAVLNWLMYLKVRIERNVDHI
jgi:hypothetical protein